MSHGKRSTRGYTEGEISQLKGKPALVAKGDGEYDLCTIQEIVYDQKHDRYLASIQKNGKKSYLTKMKIWLATHQSLISLSSSSKSPSHVPMGRVFPLIDVQREDDKTQAPWQSVSGSRSKPERISTQSGSSLTEVQFGSLKPNDFVLVSKGNSSEPTIGKVRKVFAKELNIPSDQIFADVLFEHRVGSFGNQLTLSDSLDFKWHMLVSVAHLKKLGDEIDLKDEDSWKEATGINRDFTNDYGILAGENRNLLAVLEEGKLIRLCNKSQFGKALTDYSHPRIVYYTQWKAVYCCTSSTEYCGYLRGGCVKLYSEVYFQIQFDRTVTELENLLHGRSCSGYCDPTDFLVNEKFCTMLDEQKLLIIKTCGDEEMNNTDLAPVKEQSDADAQMAWTEMKLNTPAAKLQYLAVISSSGESEIDVGIEGGINSCYLDVSLFIMFCFDNSFDEVLNLRAATDASKDAAAIDSLKNIACLLREGFFVPAYLTNELRESLSNINSGFSASFMDVEELFSVLFTQIFPTTFLELNNGGKDIIHQLLVPLPQEGSKPLMHKTTQEMMEQSFHEYRVKFSSKPHPVLMMKLPYCDGKAYFGCEGVVPSRYLDLLPVLDSTDCYAKLELYGIICLKSSHYTCFTKTEHTEDAPWVYLDSGSANRKCQVTLLPEFGKDLETIEQNANNLDLNQYKSDHSKCMQFVLRHIYLCFYRPLQ